jgi:molybdenum cofactor biosynthesis enzyme MoaA
MASTTSFFSFLRNPRSAPRVEALARRWADFSDAQRISEQTVGRFATGCGATHGVYERCNFGCTACYLGENANRQKPMPFKEVKEQLDALADYLGPGGNVQITSGEVTLLPVEDLSRIVAYARSKKLSPMVMTHGDVLLHDRAYLEKLIVDAGLTKLSFHVDITQRGRKGWSRPESEAQLNEVRDVIAEMLREAKAKTGRKMKAATTMTINQHNLGQIKDVLPNFLKNLDTFRILSFQPQAKTGRTRKDDGAEADEVWQALQQAFGEPLNPHALRFGHKDCNRIAMLLALQTGKEPIYLQAVRPDNAMDRKFLDRLMRDFAGVTMNDAKLNEYVGKALGMLLRKPWWLGIAALYTARRSWQERRHIPSVIGAALRGKLRIRPFAFVVHAFMDRSELDTEKGKERLDACVFRLPVNGRMVPMCEMNGSELRESTYEV